MVTILRAYYNFCKPMKIENEKELINPSSTNRYTDKQYVMRK
jgi:hypothetical protein